MKDRDDRAWQPLEYFDVARLTAPHGVTGELRAISLTEVPGRLEALKQTRLRLADGRLEERVREVRLRPAGTRYLVRLEGCSSREQAEALRGCCLTLPREEAGPLPEGRWYVSDLIGCRITCSERGEIGRLFEVIEGVGSDIWVVRRPQMKDILIPILSDTIVDVDLTGRRILLRLPEGLWEIYGS
ncbi:MAG: ribosome maturation factor RimM [Bacillota bacterium]|nr:ribosome maturation factor RimM [Bacillota bacterium]